MAQELESIEQMLGKEAYLDSDDNPLKLLRRLRVLSDRIPAQQKEYDDLLHQEQEIAEKLGEVAHRNSTLLEGLEQRTDIASHGAMVRCYFSTCTILQSADQSLLRAPRLLRTRIESGRRSILRRQNYYTVQTTICSN